MINIAKHICPSQTSFPGDGREFQPSFEFCVGIIDAVGSFCSLPDSDCLAAPGWPSLVRGLSVNKHDSCHCCCRCISVNLSADIQFVPAACQISKTIRYNVLVDIALDRKDYVG